MNSPGMHEGRLAFANLDHATRAVLSCAATTTFIPDQPALLAHRVLGSGPESRFSPLTIAQLSEVQPDGKQVAAHIGRVHGASNIDTSVPPRIARAGVVLLAGAALDVIRREALWAASAHNVATPTALTRDICRPGGRWRKDGIRRRGALALQAFLETTNPDLVSEVRDAVASLAQSALVRAPEYRRGMVAHYRAKGPRKTEETVANIRLRFRHAARLHEESLQNRISVLDQV